MEGQSREGIAAGDSLSKRRRRKKINDNVGLCFVAKSFF
jgi:hypothetical protein